MDAEPDFDHVLINLFGSGCTIAAGYLENDVMEKLTTYMRANKVSLEEVLSDYRNLHWLEIEKVRKWQHFGIHFFGSGLYDNTYSLVELKVNNKKKLKIAVGDIYHQRSLFPIYNKKIKHISLSENSTEKQMLIITETVIGKTGTARFKVKKFDIEKLLFCFTSVVVNDSINYHILTETYYAEKKLSYSKPDVLVNGFYAMII